MVKLPVYSISAFKEKEQENFFYANDLRTHLKSHQFINEPHKHSTYIAVLFTKGNGEHQIDYTTYPVKPGSVFLLSPGQVHCWKLSNDADGYVFFHTKDFYDSIFINRRINDFPFFYLQQNYPVVYLKAKEQVAVELIFKEIHQEEKGQLPFVQSKLGTLVDLLYINLSRYYLDNHDMSQVNPSGYLKVRELQRLIDQHFKDKKLPKEYAGMMHISTRHLARLCQELLNKTTTDLIAERIIIEAKRLLTHSDQSISNVSEELGYDDYSYFVRFFKKQTGVSPKQFQQKKTNWNA
ncbi:MAG TPA: helix-turn-helix domain-containing protein [Cytophagaceae bacterium]|jgi:AraC family transcriptional activator of pobA|nr:helix-turn-helix domain-containing protein [Cytophagaceae bacterium]